MSYKVVKMANKDNITISGLYVDSADLTARKITLCKSYNDKGKAEHTIKTFASYNIFEHVYRYIGKQCNITLSNDSKSVIAIHPFKELIEVPEV
jgi:UDP-N-acetylmuramoylalanine-D-glutamate ligase